MKIGLVDLDTSHPPAWIPIIRDLGHQVAGVYDHGDVHPPEFARRFVEQHACGKVYDDLSQMIKEVDCAIIHSCNWDAHVQRARPFVEAGTAVLVDKPIAGDLRDLNQFRRWADSGARIAGGSSLRFCEEIRSFLAEPIGQRDTPRTVFCGCAVDGFNYGIHAYSMLAALMGTGAVSVRHLSAEGQRRIQVTWPDGRVGILVVGKATQWLPFYATVITEKVIKQFVVNNQSIYRTFLEIVLPYLSGQIDQPPVPMDTLLLPELWAVAARRSWENDNGEVRLEDLSEDDGGYDGAAFTEEYRREKYADERVAKD